LVAFRLRLSTLLLFELEMPFMRGELAFPPTRVLVLMCGGPATDPALDVGRD
jgi:hypothetical protein